MSGSIFVIFTYVIVIAAILFLVSIIYYAIRYIHSNKNKKINVSKKQNIYI